MVIFKFQLLNFVIYLNIIMPFNNVFYRDKAKMFSQRQQAHPVIYQWPLNAPILFILIHLLPNLCYYTRRVL